MGVCRTQAQISWTIRVFCLTSALLPILLFELVFYWLSQFCKAVAFGERKAHTFTLQIFKVLLKCKKVSCTVEWRGARTAKCCIIWAAWSGNAPCTLAEVVKVLENHTGALGWTLTQVAQIVEPPSLEIFKICGYGPRKLALADPAWAGIGLDDF